MAARRGSGNFVMLHATITTTATPTAASPRRRGMCATEILAAESSTAKRKKKRKTQQQITRFRCTRNEVSVRTEHLKKKTKKKNKTKRKETLWSGRRPSSAFRCRFPCFFFVFFFTSFKWRSTCRVPPIKKDATDVAPTRRPVTLHVSFPRNVKS